MAESKPKPALTFHSRSADFADRVLMATLIARSGTPAFQTLMSTMHKRSKAHRATSTMPVIRESADQNGIPIIKPVAETKTAEAHPANPLPAPKQTPQTRPAEGLLRREPLMPPKQSATIRTPALVYDPMNPPTLDKCNLRRKVLSSGKTAFVIGYDLESQPYPQVILQWAGEFVDEGQKPFKLRIVG